MARALWLLFIIHLLGSATTSPEKLHFLKFLQNPYVGIIFAKRESPAVQDWLLDHLIHLNSQMSLLIGDQVQLIQSERHSRPLDLLFYIERTPTRVSSQFSHRSHPI